jgi:hypothetical protein
LSYALVFAAEAGLYIIAAGLAVWAGKPAADGEAVDATPSPLPSNRQQNLV